jgi:hypothetical protein
MATKPLSMDQVIMTFVKALASQFARTLGGKLATRVLQQGIKEKKSK